MAEASRWDDKAVAPRVTSVPEIYDFKAAGPVRRAELRDGDTLLGSVWTDDQDAAGFTPDDAAGPAGRRAGSAVWAIHRDAYAEDVPASEILDPALYESVGVLGEPQEPDA